MIKNLYKKNKSVLLYGGGLALLLFFFKWLELRLLIIHHSFEFYITSIALLFMAIGIWLALKLTKPKMVEIEKEVYKTIAIENINEEEILKSGLSKRELEVLQLMATGLTNQEIANQLFVSLNTIKTHSSNVFEKLEVNRRTQAIEKAKRLKIIT